MSCRSACFKRRVSMCRVVCFFVLFMCFFAPFFFVVVVLFLVFCFLTCQTVEGRHTVSHLLYRGVFSELREAGFAAVNLPPRPYSQSGLPCGGG